MTQIRTTGDLRAFLGETLLGIRDGTVKDAQAGSISRIAAQINNSLAVEVNAAIALQRLGKNPPVAGTMSISDAAVIPAPKVVAAPQEAMRVWCEQCEKNQNADMASVCKSPFCKAKEKLGL